MTLKEIKERKAELQNKINEAKSQEELEELRNQVEAINKEVPEEEKEEISKEEERNLIADTKELEKRSKKDLKIFKEEEKMDERKFTIADKEYRSAWAKKLMGLSEDKFTEEEKRALGDAVTTTATTFVASAEGTQGINNGGLFVPASVRTELLEIIEKQSPIYRDIRKLQVAGNIDLPYLFEADDAEWYTEVKDTTNQGQEYRTMQLTGFELAKDIVITWKLEEMAVESFIAFILEELAHKMGIALVNAVIYGDGKGKPTGITNGLTAVTTGDDQIENILNTYESLNDESAINAKVYMSRKAALNIMKYKDKNGNYPYLSGVPVFMAFEAEVDPYLKNYDVLAGNAKNYILNEVTPIRVDKETNVKGRKVIYGGYAIYDGKAKPNAFAYGKYTPTV